MTEVALAVGCPLQTAYARLYAARHVVEAALRRATAGRGSSEQAPKSRRAFSMQPPPRPTPCAPSCARASAASRRPPISRASLLACRSGRSRLPAALLPRALLRRLRRCVSSPAAPLPPRSPGPSWARSSRSASWAARGGATLLPRAKAPLPRPSPRWRAPPPWKAPPPQRPLSIAILRPPPARSRLHDPPRLPLAAPRPSRSRPTRRLRTRDRLRQDLPLIRARGRDRDRGPPAPARAERLGASASSALALTDEHARRFSGGALAQEREFIAVSALLSLGRTADAGAAPLACSSASPARLTAGGSNRSGWEINLKEATPCLHVSNDRELRRLDTWRYDDDQATFFEMVQASSRSRRSRRRLSPWEVASRAVRSATRAAAPSR